MRAQRKCTTRFFKRFNGKITLRIFIEVLPVGRAGAKNGRHHSIQIWMSKYGEIKLLLGNVGYIEIKEFNNANYDQKLNKGRINLRSAMQFLEKSKALIIDLRENDGGVVRQSMAFCSWFAPAPKSYFETLYTSASIYNRFAPPKKVYILISSTFSAAEFTAYKIKRYLPSATIIGEKTAGGGNAHFGVGHEQYFSAILSQVSSFDEQNGNYSIEGNGVVPDIAVPADSAYAVACRLAGIKTSQASKDDTKYFKKDKQIVIQPLPRNYRDYLGDYSR
jgi:retinol-binding protein 3